MKICLNGAHITCPCPSVDCADASAFGSGWIRSVTKSDYLSGIRDHRTAYLGVQQLGADEGQEELFERHAVVREKATQSEGERRQDAHPADLAAAYHVAQAEIRTYRHQHSQQGKNELTQGEAKEQALLIVPDFFVDANSDKISLLSF